LATTHSPHWPDVTSEQLVKVARIDGDTVFVRILRDTDPWYEAGVVFPLDAGNIRSVPSESALMHRSGLVAFA
jgi:hypothetical protein